MAIADSIESSPRSTKAAVSAALIFPVEPGGIGLDHGCCNLAIILVLDVGSVNGVYQQAAHVAADAQEIGVVGAAFCCEHPAQRIEEGTCKDARKRMRLGGEEIGGSFRRQAREDSSKRSDWTRCAGNRHQRHRASTDEYPSLAALPAETIANSHSIGRSFRPEPARAVLVTARRREWRSCRRTPRGRHRSQLRQRQTTGASTHRGRHDQARDKRSRGCHRQWMSDTLDRIAIEKQAVTSPVKGVEALARIQGDRHRIRSRPCRT